MTEPKYINLVTANHLARAERAQYLSELFASARSSLRSVKERIGR